MSSIWVLLSWTGSMAAAISTKATSSNFREELLSEVMRMGAQIVRNLFLFLQGLVNSK
jgi:hypothetical protein